MIELREKDGSVLLRVTARPGASRSAVQGVHGEALKVAVQAPPERGKANKQLLAFLAKALGLKKSQLTLAAGHTSREKTVAITGVEVAALREQLQSLTG